jgi:hypothetical protein
MDPIGFALENFDAIGLWRTADGTTAVNPVTQVFDNTNVTSAVDLRNWLTQKYDDQFAVVAAEKLLTYALGRGVEYRDQPLVRAIARETMANQGRFSALVLGVVKSRPFQMNTKVEAASLAANTTAPANSDTRGVD